MKIYVYPTDVMGCGYYRLIWPAEALQKLGYDITICLPGEPSTIHVEVNGEGVIENLEIPNDADVIVFQRVTRKVQAQIFPLIRARGVAVVMDIDDDLSRIHPANPVFKSLHPNNVKNDVNGHSWKNAIEAGKNATLVTVSTEPLLQRYAPLNRGKGCRYLVIDFEHPCPKSTRLRDSY
ncbi:MAG: hypothetical protein V3W04_13025 [Gammaproteobacteria bacterium]